MGSPSDVNQKLNGSSPNDLKVKKLSRTERKGKVAGTGNRFAQDNEGLSTAFEEHLSTIAFTQYNLHRITF